MGILCYEVFVLELKFKNILEEIVWYKEKEVDYLCDKEFLVELRKKINLMFFFLDFLIILLIGKI